MPDPCHTASYYNTAPAPGSNNTGGRGLGRDRVPREAHAPSVGRARGAVQPGSLGNNDSTRPAAHGHGRGGPGGQDRGTPQARARGNPDTAQSTQSGRGHGGSSTEVRGLGSAGASRTASAPSAGRGPETAQIEPQAGPTTSRRPRAEPIGSASEFQFEDDNASRVVHLPGQRRSTVSRPRLRTESIGSASEFQFDDDDTRSLVHLPGQPRTFTSRYRPRAASIGSASEFQLEDDDGSPVIHLPSQSRTVASRRRPRAASMGSASEYISEDDDASPMVNLPGGYRAATERPHDSGSTSPRALHAHERPISTTSIAEGHRYEGRDMGETFTQTEPMIEPKRAYHGSQASSRAPSDASTNDRKAHGFGVTPRYNAVSDSDYDSDLIEAWSDGDLENDYFIPWISLGPLKTPLDY